MDGKLDVTLQSSSKKVTFEIYRNYSRRQKVARSKGRSLAEAECEQISALIIPNLLSKVQGGI